MTLTKKGYIAIAVILAIGLAVGGYFIYKNSKKADGRRTEIDTKSTYQMQVYASDDAVPKDKQFVSGASGVIGEYQEKTLYDAIIDLQKSTPSWKIEFTEAGKNANIKSIKGISNGKYGNNSKWEIKLNKNKLTKSIYETKIKRQDNIEIYFETK